MQSLELYNCQHTCCQEWVKLLICINVFAATCCANLLKQAEVPLIDTSTCNQSDYYDGLLLDHMVCAGYENGGTDACDVGFN